MKTNKTAVIVAAFLGLALVASVSCKRDAVNPPSSPIGPSSIGVMMNVQASPNVILAGVHQRQTTTITASLKKYDGSGQANRTVLFEVVDADLERIDVGYFEGSSGVVTKTTDSGGNVSVTYFGPLSDEITASGSVFVRASTAWEGSQFIMDTAEVFLIRDAEQMTLDAKAIPDVLYAGMTRPTSVIQATVVSGGKPAQNYPVFFLLNNEVGRFADGKRYTFSNTNAQGVATITYVGPAFYEMDPLNPVQTISITVQVTQELSKDVSIQLIRQR